MTEQEYDEIIAPMLLVVAKEIDRLGGNLVARVEWVPGEFGLTAHGDMKNAGIGQYLTYFAAKSNGNIDAMLFALIRDKDVSQSIFLHSHNKKRDAA